MKTPNANILRHAVETLKRFLSIFLDIISLADLYMYTYTYITYNIYIILYLTFTYNMCI